MNILSSTYLNRSTNTLEDWNLWKIYLFLVDRGEKDQWWGLRLYLAVCYIVQVSGAGGNGLFLKVLQKWFCFCWHRAKKDRGPIFSQVPRCFWFDLRLFVRKKYINWDFEVYWTWYIVFQPKCSICSFRLNPPWST